MEKTLMDISNGNLSNAIDKTLRLEIVKSSNRKRLTKRITGIVN